MASQARSDLGDWVRECEPFLEETFQNNLFAAAYTALQGCAPMQAGQGNGLTLRDLGESGGEQIVTLLETEMPLHSHGVQAATTGGLPGPGNNVWASALRGRPGAYAASNPPTNVQMNLLAAPATGGNLPHNNMHPYLCLTLIIALPGVFPPRS